MISETIIKLDKSRKELLDLSLRNTLINYSRKRKQIEIVDEKSDSIFDIMVAHNKKMTFLPVPEELLEEEGAESDIELMLAQPEEIIDERGYAERHYDTKLQTKMSSDKLQKKLLSIHNDAKTYLEEQGVNILYLALGFLHWHESESSGQYRRAPLVLIPVNISRRSAKDRFSIEYNSDDIGENLSLAEKLRTEFAIELPVIGDIEEFNIDEYFGKVELAIGGMKNWHVERDDITLGFFSFGKFLMYKDLDAEQWRNEDASVLDALLNEGFRDNVSEFSEDENIDDMVRPENSYLIKDADRTQVLAILDACSGKSMVIQGPPGTGKSQTITNIIAENIAREKKILFVSEKMAALDVVKSRLDQAGIGDAVLELHSFKTNKKNFLAELERVMMSGRPKVNDDRYDVQDYVAARERLNSYCDAVNKIIDGTCFSFIYAIGQLNKINNPIGDDAYPKLDINQEDYQKIRSIMTELADYLKEYGSPDKNPFSQSSLSILPPEDKSNISKTIKQAIDNIGRILATTSEISAVTNVTFTPSIEEMRLLIKTLEQSKSAPDLEQVDLHSDRWVTDSDNILATLSKANELKTSYSNYHAVLIDEAWDTDFLNERKVIASVGNKWWRFLSGDYRKAARNVKGYIKGSFEFKADEVVKMLDSVMYVRKNQHETEQSFPMLKQLINENLDINNTDWDRLRNISSWMCEKHTDVKAGNLMECLFDLINNEKAAGLDKKCGTIIELIENTNELINSLTKLTKIAISIDSALQDKQNSLQNWLDNIDQLDDIVYFNSLRKRLEEYSKKELADIAFGWKYTPKDYLDAYDYFWYKEITDRTYRNTPEIANFNCVGHKTKITSFSEIDKKLMAKNCEKIALQHWNNIPKGFDGEMGTIRNEIAKKRKHMPIRKLIESAGHAIQAIKPVFMMSPMSIATYLPLGTLKFDLVIFDEASQVKPVDAFGAILRGKQTLVVGDSKQLPPTNFFGKIGGESEDEDDYTNVGDMESILSLFTARGALERMLRWHYRSRHDSLIAVSNYKFYDNRLIVFPSPHFDLEGKGLSLKYSPQTVYDKGKSRTNQKEAEIVAQAVMQHAKTQPQRSLGVVAFSMEQRDAIEAHLEHLRANDESCEDFFARDKHEHFFVKNLENVQGDERDAIYISIGYGKTAEGQLSMNFGPLTKNGGERRLNVLISRAKLSMVVFSNFRAAEMDLRNSTSAGSHALRYFLEYAETKKIQQPYSTGKDTDSPFEDAVINALYDRGIDTEPQVGTSGYRIDIGIKHSDSPGRYILGIECDGATYHSAKAARDRDRLRQEVLEGLGWNIHRIWSTDWYRSPEKELEKVLHAIKEAGEKQFDEEAVLLQQQATQKKIERETHTEAELFKAQEYAKSDVAVFLFGRNFHELYTGELIPYIIEVAKTESPIHVEELTKRLRLSAGIQKSGSRIQSAVYSACLAGSKNGDFKFRDNFVWDSNMEIPVVRDRSGLENQEKKIEFICDEEIREALKLIIKNAFSIPETEAVLKTSNILGFARTTENISNRIQDNITRLVNWKQVTNDNNILMLKND
jgi:very-short-patch-repair endonuclease/DNA polymerase III delta prime subunit